MLVLEIPLVSSRNGLSDVVTLLLSGALGIGIADSIFFWSLNRLGAGRVAIVSCFYSPSVCLCAAIYLAEAVKPTLVVAIILNVVAIIVGALPRRGAGRGLTELESGGTVPVLGGVLAIFMMAVGIVIAKPVLTHSDPFWANTIRLVGGVALLAIQALSKQHRSAVLRALRPSKDWRKTGPASIVGGYLALTFWISGMKYTDTTIAAVLNQLSDVFVLILAALILKEKLTRPKVVAIFLGVGAGILAVI
jgi:drug/metabolite transporter (DMT)-like permease